MEIAIIGGTGQAGAATTTALREAGVDPLLLGRRAPGTGRHRAVDATTADAGTLARALRGVDVLVHATNARRHPERLLVRGTSALLDAGQAAGVAHHVVLSIVGADGVPGAYYRAKVRQEAVAREHPATTTVLRTSQFHELVDLALAALARRRIGPRGTAPLRPLAAGRVGTRLAALAQAPPGPPPAALVGPQRRTVGELARAWRAHDGRRTVPLPLPTPRGVRAGALCGDADAEAVGPTFEDWLADRAAGGRGIR